MGMLAGEAGALFLHFLALECLCLVLLSQLLSGPAKRAATVYGAVEEKARMCDHLLAFILLWCLQGPQRQGALCQPLRENSLSRLVRVLRSR